MATHSSILARKIPRTEEPGYKVAKSQTQLKQFSSHTLSIYWTLTMPQTLCQHVSRLLILTTLLGRQVSLFHVSGDGTNQHAQPRSFRHKWWSFWKSLPMLFLFPTVHSL